MPFTIRTPIICGPTAGGKSDLAIGLVRALREMYRISAEIVTADAYQVYRGLNIGTATPTLEERAGIPHHLIDIVHPGTGEVCVDHGSGTGSLAPARGASSNPYTPFTVDRWLELAEHTIAELRARNVLPIVVGGTHLYVKALLDGLFDGPEPDAGLRKELNAMDSASRRAELERVDPAAAARIHPNDIRRAVRALEVFRLTGKPISDHQTQWQDDPGKPPAGTRTDYQLVGLDWPSDLINPRINTRAKGMIERGLVDEVRSLYNAGALGPQAREALGYKQLIQHIEGHVALDDAIEQIKIETRRFAKNQRTWLRRLRSTPGSVWLEAATQDRWVDRVLGSCLDKKSHAIP